MEKSRIEQILKYGLGEVSTLPPNLSRVEELLVRLIESGGGSGTTNYESLSNKPSINGVTLQGNLGLSTLGIQEIEDGKDLSTNDFSDLYKDKLDGIDSGANVNAIEKIIVNGTEVIPNNRKEVLITVITNAVNDLLNYYTKTETDNRIILKMAEIIADAPEDLDTLKEISDWIEHHEESASAMNSAIQANTTAISGKVDKVSGKVLSDNNYTTAEKNKLANLENYDDSTVKSRISRLVDAGAKNLIDILHPSNSRLQTIIENANGTYTLSGSGTWLAWDVVCSVKQGTKYIFRCNFTSVSTDGNGIFVIKDANSSDLFRRNINNNTEIETEIEPSTATVTIGFSTNNGSTSGSGSFTMNPMLCTAEDYAISPEFVPYVPTNRELYEMILALQNQNGG